MRTEIAEGETVELIPGHNDPQARREYVTKVVKGEISLSHSEQYAKEGARYTAGDEGHLKNLKGKAIHAYAHEGPAIVEMDTDAFLFDLFGTRTAERPNDKATRQNDLIYRHQSATAAAGGATTVLSIPNGQDHAFRVGYASLAIRGNEANTGDFFGYLHIVDENGNTQLFLSANIHGWPFNLDPQPALKTGWTAEIVIENFSGANVDVNGTLIFADPENQ